MSEPNRYLVHFSATTDVDLEHDASTRIGESISAMPGVVLIGQPAMQHLQQQVLASFEIEVAHGIGDAARDGSRLAKQALHSADLGHARLTTLTVELVDTPDTGSFA